ncbi:MAG: helix-turn-helix transcriptional regulator [Acidimicrobiales bacterium]
MPNDASAGFGVTVPVTPRLLGRERELLVLDDVLAGATRGAGAMVLLEGEAGIGKTAVVAEAVRRAAELGFATAVGAARELESHRPFAAVAEALDLGPDAADRRRAHLGQLLAAGAPSGSLGPFAESASVEFAVSEGVVDLVEHICASASLLVVVEDLQWADPSSLLTMARLARSVPALPAVLVATARPLPRPEGLARLLDDLQRRGARRLRVGPLAPDVLIALVETVAGGPPGPRLARQASGWGGNPLFVREALAALADEGAIRFIEDGRAEVDGDAGLPPSLAVTILHRLSYLAPDTLEVLSLASVLGAVVEVADLCLLAGRTAASLAPALREARQAGILAESGARLAFRHELLREALYGDLPEGFRAKLHVDLARTLDGAGASSEKIADHLLRGALEGDAEAVGLLHRAARLAASKSPSIAVELLERALVLGGPAHRERASMAADLAVATMWSGRLVEGEDRCRDVLASVGGSEAADRLRLGLVQSFLLRGAASPALTECQAGTAIATSPSWRARFAGYGAFARLFVGDLPGAAAAAVDAEAQSRAADDDEGLVAALLTRAFLANLAARFGEAARFAEEAARRADASANPETHRLKPYMCLAAFLLDLDRLDDAVVANRRSRQAHEALLGARADVAFFHLVSAWAGYLEGRWDDALAEADAALEIGAEASLGWMPFLRSVTALVALHRGDHDAARLALTRAETEMAGGGAAYRFLWVAWGRALLLEAEGRPDAALAHLGGYWEGAALFGVVCDHAVVGPDLVRLAVAADDRARAEAVSAAIDAVAEANPGVATIEGAALRARGLLRADPAVLVTAAEALRRGPRPLDTALACEDAAAALAAAGDLVAAGELLDEATAGYEGLDALWDADRARARLRAFGVRQGRRGPRRRPRTGWEALTATELRVVALVAERRSNPEIAERMYLSRRTVQTHVSHALRKLGLRSRLELAAEVGRGGHILERLGEQPQQR